MVDGGKYGPGFHAHVVVSKVDDSLPLERQEKILGRSGLEINKSTLCEVFSAISGFYTGKIYGFSVPSEFGSIKRAIRSIVVHFPF